MRQLCRLSIWRFGGIAFPPSKLEANFAHVENRRAKTRVLLGHLLGSAELCECPSVFAVGPVCD